ncbi:type III secretion apparatus assembly chaperone SctY [Halodesulfovibrio marinisediminis]|uniref:Uncharacterized protein n=1 Tax=Halodesulfovibrio marinisediminis DSM 17456 TaxID=1121457 RepID=A0A1N6I8S2_9BACT|nr:hypothetical protein [Halodesulfovibrio marinisediminis]SIO28355.1 hypothetical protein SAMN02745161_2520 [Halodesulfovibrio marinisediminis DSM 17456]
MKLSKEQRKVIEVLGYTYLRVGQFDKAERIFQGLASLFSNDLKLRRYLAYIATAKGDPASALSLLSECIDPVMMRSDDAPLLLIQAKALWGLGRQSESKDVFERYLLLVEQN